MSLTQTKQISFGDARAYFSNAHKTRTPLQVHGGNIALASVHSLRTSSAVCPPTAR